MSIVQVNKSEASLTIMPKRRRTAFALLPRQEHSRASPLEDLHVPSDWGLARKCDESEDSSPNALYSGSFVIARVSCRSNDPAICPKTKRLVRA